MVSFYKVSGISWMAGRPLVKAPYLTMVNLVAGRDVVPELMQSAMTGPRLASEAARLLDDPGARERMRAGLADVAQRLSTVSDPIETAADCVLEIAAEDTVHVS